MKPPLWQPGVIEWRNLFDTASDFSTEFEQMRYFIAIVVAALLIGGGFLFVHQTWRSLDEMVRDGMRKQKLAGTLPPELQNVDIDAGKLPDFQMQLPAAWETRVKVAMALGDWWYIWTPLTVVGCLSVAALFGRKPVAD
jgi:hypothetical protein